MSHTREITQENFIEQTRQGIVLIDWWAKWCGPCRAFAPVFEAVAGENPDVAFGKVDTDAQPDLASTFRIQSIPTIMAFRDGVLLYARPGTLTHNQLAELVSRVREVDMEAVRLEIAKADAARGNGGVQASANEDPS